VIKFLDLHAQYLSIKSEIDAAIATTIAESSYINPPRNTQFEREFAAYQQAAHCVGDATGTDAIEILLEAMALPPGSEVITPANSFIASTEAVTRAGHRVVFGDVDDRTYTLDPADVARRITPKTSAILLVHLYGQPCDLDAFAALARQHGLRLIEDCAQAHGAEWKGRRVGTIGGAGTFSFFPGKNLGAYGDAGAIVTADEALAKRCRMIANHGRTAKYNHVFEGRNSRLDGLQAAILLAKLKHLDGWIERRRAVARRYRERLSNVAGIVLPVESPEDRHAYHQIVMLRARRDAIDEFLNERVVQKGIHYPIALPKLAAYDYLGQRAAPMVSNRIDSELLSLPMGEHLTDAEVDEVCAAVAAFPG
jgi:dTDP-4-amino-4,6-dideoxygalactose transaminase